MKVHIDPYHLFANVLGVNIGMFYKRRDYSVIVNGKIPSLHMNS